MMANLDAVELLNDFGRASPGVFGGLRIEADGGLVIYFCKDVEANLLEANAYLAANGASVEVLRAERCEYSLRHLTTTVNELSEEMPRLNAGRADVRGISVDVTRNRVVVSLGRDDASTTNQIRNVYGRIVVFEHQTAETFPASRKPGEG